MIFNYTHDQGLSCCHGDVIAIKNAKKKTVIVKWAEEHVGEGEKSEMVQKLSDCKWKKSQEQEGAWREYLTEYLTLYRIYSSLSYIKWLNRGVYEMQFD